MIRYDDVANDPRLEQAAIDRYLGAQIQAFVSIPLVQGGLTTCMELTANRVWTV